MELRFRMEQKDMLSRFHCPLVINFFSIGIPLPFRDAGQSDNSSVNEVYVIIHKLS